MSAIVIPAVMVLASIRQNGSKFFKVVFARKNDKWGKDEQGNKVLVAKAGELRTMVCRRGVRKFVTGAQAPGQRAAEDKANDVLTVWDVPAFHAARREGKSEVEAGKAAYRRINVPEVVELSCLTDEQAAESADATTLAELDALAGEQVAVPA